MLCCLNPECLHPINPDGTQICQSCGEPLVTLLRNRYRPVKPIGQGGFGKTYLAQDTDRLNAPCVIKQFTHQSSASTSDGSFEKALKLFNQEALRLNELGEHSQIPTLLAYFEHNSQLYLVQQVIEGHTLIREVQHRGAFTEAAIRSLLADLLPVLQFIHDRKVVHRDINPSNIIRRSKDGRLVLIDFGIAKQLEASLGDEEAGTRIGTEGYSPIEQLRSGEAYPSSDLYSLGTTCLFLLTACKPEKIYSALEGRWRWREKLQEAGRSVSPQLGEILDRLVKDLISDRYQAATDVLRDLQRLPSMPQSVPGWTRQHTGDSILADTISNSGVKKSLFNPADKPVSQPRFSGPFSDPFSGPQKANGAPASDSDDSPPQPEPYTHRQTLAPKTHIQSSGYSAFQASSEIARWRLLRTFSGHTSWVSAVAINPQIPLVASSGLDDVVNLWNLKTGAVTYALRGHSRGINDLAFSPRGQILVSCSDDQTIKVWSVGTGKMLYTLQGHTRDVTSIAIGARGIFLVSGSEDRSIRLWKLDRGSPIKLLSSNAGMVKSVAITPDEQTVVSGGFDNKIRLWKLPSGETLRILSGHLKSVSDLVISQDGRLIASASKDKTVRLWSLRSGNLIHTLHGHTREVNAVALTPDQRTVVSAGGDCAIKVWDTRTGELVETLTEHHSSVTDVDINPSGRYMVTASSDNTVKLWERQ
ncbi:MAG: protein kinase [Leptolyngbya sp. SIO4C1]|nr:protein kinase [Leptolyngbya sp. SIO4C1]